MKCQSCGKDRRDKMKTQQRPGLGNFHLCGRCANSMNISKNIQYMLQHPLDEIEWNRLLEETKEFARRRLI